MQMSEQERNAFLAEEAKRAKYHLVRGALDLVGGEAKDVCETDLGLTWL